MTMNNLPRTYNPKDCDLNKVRQLLTSVSTIHPRLNQVIRNANAKLSIEMVIGLPLEMGQDRYCTYCGLIIDPVNYDDLSPLDLAYRDAIKEDCRQLIDSITDSTAEEILSIHLWIEDGPVELITDGNLSLVIGLLPGRKFIEI
jgi:hypothetical protein